MGKTLAEIYPIVTKGLVHSQASSAPLMARQKTCREIVKGPISRRDAVKACTLSGRHGPSYSLHRMPSDGPCRRAVEPESLAGPDGVCRPALAFGILWTPYLVQAVPTRRTPLQDADGIGYATSQWKPRRSVPRRAQIAEMWG